MYYMKVSEAGGKAAFDQLSGEKLNEVLVQASQVSFRSVAILPAALLIVFAVIWIYDRKHGVKHEELDSSGLPE